MDVYNMIPLWAESLSLKAFVADDLDRIYQRNKLQMYAIGRASEAYDCVICKRLPLDRQLRFKKSVCIIEYVYYLVEHNDEGMENKEVQCILCDLDRIFKKAYKELYSNIIRIKKTDIFDFKSFFKDFDNMTTESFVSSIAALLWFFENYCPDKTDAINTLQDCLVQRNYENVMSPPRYGDVLKEDKKIIDSMISSLKVNYIHEMFVVTKGNFDSYVQFLYDNLDLSPLTLFEEYPLTKQDLREVVTCFYFSSLYKEQGEAALDSFIVWGLHLRLLLKSYNGVKKIFFQNNQETLFDELKMKEEKLKQISEELQSQEFRLTQEKKALTNENTAIIKENEELRRKLKKMESELAAASDHKAELDALREFAFKFQSDDLTDTVQNVDFEKIDAAAGIIIGGHPNWQKKMKERLPNWTFISSDLRKFDSDLLRKRKHIVLNTSSMNHALYYFTMNNIKHDNSLFYVSKTSCEETLAELSLQLDL